MDAIRSRIRDVDVTIRGAVRRLESVCNEIEMTCRTATNKDSIWVEMVLFCDSRTMIAGVVERPWLFSKESAEGADTAAQNDAIAKQIEDATANPPADNPFGSQTLFGQSAVPTFRPKVELRERVSASIGININSDQGVHFIQIPDITAITSENVKQLTAEALQRLTSDAFLINEFLLATHKHYGHQPRRTEAEEIQSLALKEYRQRMKREPWQSDEDEVDPEANG